MANQNTQSPAFNAERILTQITLKLRAHQELRDILCVVLEGFKSLVDARKALFAICDEDGRIQQAVVEGLAWSGDLDALPISRTVLREAFEGTGPILLPDALSDEDYSAQTSIRQNALRMIVAVPVRTNDDLIGILYADSPKRAREQGFAQCLDALEALATLVSLVVENARLYAEQRFRARYLARLAHDLRSSLHSAALNADYLQSALPTQDPDQREAQRDLQFSLEEMNRQLTNSSSITDMLLQGTPTRFDLQALIEHLTSTVPALAREHGLTIRLDIPELLPLVTGWPSRLQAALDNLLSNALKFADAESTITISAVHRPDRSPAGVIRRSTGDAAFLFQQVRPLTPDTDGGFVEIGVHNYGPPIDPAMLPRLFEAYVCEGGERRGLRSTGLGLAIVAEAAERSGGRVWIESLPRHGTTVRITIPCRLATESQEV